MYLREAISVRQEGGVACYIFDRVGNGHVVSRASRPSHVPKLLVAENKLENPPFDGG